MKLFLFTAALVGLALANPINHISIGPAIVGEFSPAHVEPAFVEESPIHVGPIQVGPIIVDESPIHVGPAIVEESPVHVGPAIVDEGPIHVGPAIIWPIDWPPISDAILEENIHVEPAFVEEKSPISIGPVFVDEDGNTVSGEGVAGKSLLQYIINIDEITVNQIVNQIANIGNRIVVRKGNSEQPERPEGPEGPEKPVGP